jgi:peptidoglycan biosynthesis protein MviN/MurJ (putative lipid II flippase)
MSHKARRLLFASALVWLALGLIGLAALAGFGSTFAAVVIMLPAIPLYLLSTRFGREHASSGLFWLAAHGPPFLNIPGVVVVYLAPAVLILAWLVVRRLQRLT